MAKKYIDADKLEKDGWSMQRIRQVSSTEMVYETKKPTDFPAADVAEVRHGRWTIYPVSPWDGEDVKCSVCGEKGCAPYWDYCPHCGSQMVDVVSEE